MGLLVVERKIKFTGRKKIIGREKKNPEAKKGFRKVKMANSIKSFK